jgi:hypothetical protein
MKLLLVYSLFFATCFACGNDHDVALRKQGESIVEIFNTRDVQSLVAIVDFHAMGKIALDPLGYPKKSQEELIGGFNRAKQEMMADVIQGLERQHAKAKLSQSLSIDGGSAHLLRIDFFNDDGESGGYNYWRLRLDERGRIYDWYDFVFANWQSEVMRRVFMTAVPPSGADDAAMRTMRSYAKSIKEGDISGAYAWLEKMPSQFRASHE